MRTEIILKELLNSNIIFYDKKLNSMDNDRTIRTLRNLIDESYFIIIPTKENLDIFKDVIKVYKDNYLSFPSYMPYECKTLGKLYNNILPNEKVGFQYYDYEKEEWCMLEKVMIKNMYNISKRYLVDNDMI